MTTNNALGTPWWKSSKEDASGVVFAAALRIARQLASRRTDDALYMRMYGARDVLGQGEGTGSPKSDLDANKYNLVRAVVNTAASAISSIKPKPKFQTDDADFTLVQKAKACEQAVKGIMQANEYDLLSQQAFTDACVSSLGGIYIYGDEGKVKYERTFPGELLCDVREGYYGNPRTIYRARLMDRATTEEKFGVKIPVSSGDRELLTLFKWLTSDNTLEQIIVIECWHLPGCDSKGKKIPGKHCIAAPGQTLLLEDWNRPRLPFALYRWERRQIGFYGCGIVEELRGHQRALNYVNAKIADNLHLNSRSKILSFANQKGQKVKATHLDNDPSTILHVPFGVNPPQVVASNAVPPEQFSYRQSIIDDAFNQVGVTQATASGATDLGPDASGAAIRELGERGAKRWSLKTIEFERMALTTARLTIDVLREMAEDGEIKPIRAPRTARGLTRVAMIDWKKVDLDDEEFSLDLTSASSLPDTSAGRTQTVTDWLNSGLIDKLEAKALLGHPDLEAFRSLDLSAMDIILDTVERIVEDGEYFAPEPTDDLVLAQKLILQSYNKFRLRRLSQDKLDMLLDYLQDVMDLAAQGAAPQQGAPAATDPNALPAPAAQPQLTPNAAPAIAA